MKTFEKNKKFKILSICFFLLILLNFLFVLFSFNPLIVTAEHIRGNEKSILHVNGFGQNNYSKIQDAVDNASIGDTIRVHSGIYYENIIIDKTLTLIGDGLSNTIINGSIKGSGILLKANYSKISGFSIIGSKNHKYPGLYIYGSHNNSIIKCSFDSNYCGIYLIVAHNNSIMNCNFYSNKDAFEIGKSNYNKIENCNFYSNNDNGMNLSFSNNNEISNCSFSFNRNTGIHLFLSSYNTIKNSSCNSNSVGISLDQDSNNNNFLLNSFENNSYLGIDIGEGYYNLIYLNNFINNNHQKYDEKNQVVDWPGYNNRWNSSTMGNYWSDYAGSDNGNNNRINGDGIGDTQIPYLGLDYLPVMEQIDIENITLISASNTTPNDNNQSHNNKDKDIFSTSLKTIVISVTTFSIITLISSFFVGTEIGKYSFFSAVSPLYTKRKKQKDPRFEYIKGSIRGYIIGNPGDNYNEIKRVLDLPNGTLAYHLKVLEREGIIRSEKDGFYKRFYPAKGCISKEVFDFTNIQQDICNVIRKYPGISQKELSMKLDISRQRLNYHTQLMTDARIIRVERDGKRTRCFIIDEVS